MSEKENAEPVKSDKKVIEEQEKISGTYIIEIYRKIDTSYVKRIVKIIGFLPEKAAPLATIITLVMMVFTLKEDIITRNSAYMPLLKVEQEVKDKTFTLSWNTKEETLSDSDLPTLSFSLYNIGNGVANDVEVVFDKEVLVKWIEQLEDMEANGNYKSLINEKKLRTSFSWIMNDPDSPVTVSVPSDYLVCLRELYRWKDITSHESFELPGLKFTITYEDIQGKVVSYEYSYDNFFKEIGCGDDNSGGGMTILSSEIGAEKRIR